MMEFSPRDSTVDEELEAQGFNIQDMDKKSTDDDEEDDEIVKAKVGEVGEEKEGEEKVKKSIEEEDEEDTDDDLKRLERMAAKIGEEIDMPLLIEEEEAI